MATQDRSACELILLVRVCLVFLIYFINAKQTATNLLLQTGSFDCRVCLTRTLCINFISNCNNLPKMLRYISASLCLSNPTIVHFKLFLSSLQLIVAKFLYRGCQFVFLPWSQHLLNDCRNSKDCLLEYCQCRSKKDLQVVAFVLHPNKLNK